VTVQVAGSLLHATAVYPITPWLTSYQF